MPYTTGNHEPATSNVEFRTIDRHGHGMLDLERSKHPIGVTWRSWEIIGGALPERIAELRRDWGNGLITEDEYQKQKRAWSRAVQKAGAARRREIEARRKARAA